MTIEYLIKILEHRLIYLQGLKINAENSGNLEEITRLDEEILTTETTLNQIRGL